MTQHKIGFWSVLAIVIGSQVGSGIFLLPPTLAPYGYFSIIGLIITGAAALCLSSMFALLCSYLPKTGGPHVYIQSAFGSHVAFFIGWAYWFVSWVSTTLVVVASIKFLSPFIGDKSPAVYLTLEILLLFCITTLNLKGVDAAGRVEFFLTLLKFVLLIILPCAALFFFKSSNFVVSPEISAHSITKILSQVSILTMFSFIGIETGTTTAGSVENPSKTIPRAVIFGTACVFLLYFFNVFGIMGLIPAQILVNSKASYVDAAQYIFGGNWYFVVSAIISFVCIGTANAWTLTSGQTILGLAEDGLMPKIFAKKNSSQAPFFGILISSIGITVLLYLTSNENMVEQIINIIDYSVPVFLFVYLICGFAAVRLFIQKRLKINLFQWLSILISIVFCFWAIYETPAQSLVIASLFVLSGLPIYLFWYLRK
jgi:APA family basic amino acid/polyamine antiporter